MRVLLQLIFMFLIVFCSWGKMDVIASLNADLSKVRKVAICDVMNDRKASGDTISEQLTMEFMRRGFSVMERKQLERILAEQELQAGEAFDESNVVRLGKLLGVDALIFVNLGTARGAKRNRMPASIKMVSTQTGEIIIMATADAKKSVRSMKKMMEKFVRHIDRKMF